MSELIHIRRPEGRIAVERVGSGPPVVCVPGIGDWRQSYRHLVPLLVSAGYTVYSMDLRGHGASDVRFASWSATAIGDDIVALLEAEDLHDVCLVGCSVGGGAVAWAGLQAADRVSRLVMLNPFVRDMPNDRWMRPLVPVLFGGPWGGFVWAKYRATLFQTLSPDHVDNEAALGENLREPGRLAALRGMMRASKSDVAARLSEVSQPTLVVMGAQDPDYPDPAAEGETLAERIGASVTVEVLDQVGHYPQADRPADTAALIVRHLELGAVDAA